MARSDAGETARKPRRPEQPAEGRQPDGGGPPTARDSASVNRLAWIALAVAGVLAAWQVVYALTAPTAPNPDTYESVSLLLTLVLSVGAIVLGVVALGQRAVPRWPATSATAVGAFAFTVCVATWIGVLMV